MNKQTNTKHTQPISIIETMQYTHNKFYRFIAHLVVCLMMWQASYAAYAISPDQIENHLKNADLRDHPVIFGGNVKLDALAIENATVTFDKSELVHLNNLSVIDSNIISNSETLDIIVNGPVQLLSSSLDANGDLKLSAHSIDAQTVMHTFNVSGNGTDFSGMRYGRVTEITADGSIILEVEQDIVLSGVQVNSGGKITIDAGGNIVAETLVQLGNYHSGRYSEQMAAIGAPTIIEGQEVSFIAGGNAVFSGVEVKSGSNIVVDASGSIQITSIPIQNSKEEPGRTSQSIDYIVSKFGAEESLRLIAGGEIMIDSAELVASNGHLEILAGMGITVIDNQGVSQFTHSGKYGNTKVNESGYQTFAVRSLLDAGKTIKLHSLYGDITLKAADIRSVEGTTVKADSRKVKLLMSVETDHYSYSSVKEDTWTTTTTSKGHNIETGVPNTIIGGFSVEALGGIEIEYEGLKNFDNDFQCQKYLDDPANKLIDPETGQEIGDNVANTLGVCMQANVQALAKTPGLEWMGQVLIAADKNPDQVHWDKVITEYETWRTKNTNLSPAAMLVVMIAVSIMAAPAGTAMAGALSSVTSGAIGTTGIVASAVSAGTTTLISQATLITTNGALNGQSIGTILNNISSDETLKAVATSMITAGLLSAVNTEFFTELNPNSPLVQSGATGESLNLLGQSVQTVTEVTVRTGVGNLMNGGNLDEFGESFLYSLGGSVVNQLGADVAGDIGDADLDKLSKYFAHFALGCAVGVAQHGVEGNDGDKSGKACISGAGGAVIGELSAEIYSEMIPFDTSNFKEYKQIGVGYAEIMSVLLVNAAGGDFQLAGLTGRNAAENNGLSWVEKFVFMQMAFDCVINGETDCMTGTTAAAWAKSAANSKSQIEGFGEGITEAIEQYPEMVDEIIQLAGLVQDGEFNLILAGLIASVENMPSALEESLSLYLDSAVKEFATALTEEDYKQIGKSMSGIVVILAEAIVSGGAASVAAKGAKSIIEIIARGPSGNRPLSQYDNYDDFNNQNQEFIENVEFIQDSDPNKLELGANDIPFQSKYKGSKTTTSFPEHLSKGEGYVKSKRSIGGGHNEWEFEKVVAENSDIIRVAPDGKNRFDIGLTEVTYWVTPKDGAEPIKRTKTIYDPQVYSDEIMAEYAISAAEEGFDAGVKRLLEAEKLGNRPKFANQYIVEYEGITFLTTLNRSGPDVNGVRNLRIGNVHPVNPDSLDPELKHRK
ncbi:MAG: DUF637 domain-containing protein [Cellvibrionales bacterium]|nr:DUF637 domain-containing protein [Cellvibrionales bacterium]